MNIEFYCFSSNENKNNKEQLNFIFIRMFIYIQYTCIQYILYNTYRKYTVYITFYINIFFGGFFFRNET